jgi:hypothetical protein
MARLDADTEEIRVYTGLAYEVRRNDTTKSKSGRGLAMGNDSTRKDNDCTDATHG